MTGPYNMDFRPKQGSNSCVASVGACGCSLSDEEYATLTPGPTLGMVERWGEGSVLVTWTSGQSKAPKTVLPRLVHMGAACLTRSMPP